MTIDREQLLEESADQGWLRHRDEVLALVAALQSRVSSLEAALRKARDYIEPRVRGRRGSLPDGRSVGATIVLPKIAAALSGDGVTP